MPDVNPPAKKAKVKDTAIGGVKKAVKKVGEVAGDAVADNDPAILSAAKRPEDLFELFATEKWLHTLPETTKTFGQTWINSSQGSGLIRKEIRQQLETILSLARALPGFHGWFNAVQWYSAYLLYIKFLDGDEARKRELVLILDDVYDAGDWRVEDPIPIDPKWSSNKKRMAELWNSKGELFAQLVAELDLDIEPFVMAGIMAAELRQRFFKEISGLPIARFELHVFRKRWGKTSKERLKLFNQHFEIGDGWKGHKWRPMATGKFRTFHGDQDKEWEVLDFARGLDGDANE